MSDLDHPASADRDTRRCLGVLRGAANLTMMRADDVVGVSYGETSKQRLPPIAKDPGNANPF